MKVFKTFIKPSEAPQRSVKIKIDVNFLSLSGIRTERVNAMTEGFLLEPSRAELKGIVKAAEPCKCDIRLVSRIL